MSRNSRIRVNYEPKMPAEYPWPTLDDVPDDVQAVRNQRNGSMVRTRHGWVPDHIAHPSDGPWGNDNYPLF